MAQFFEDEKKYPDNQARMNLVFMGYPYAPPVAQEDYREAVRELQDELPIRLWYFLDEPTTAEMMRKIWRAILRSQMAVFDVSGGNPNVAFELGLAVAINKPCMTLLKTGEANPLGGADLGYAERIEYQSVSTLKETLRQFLTAKSDAVRLIHGLSFDLHSDTLRITREELEEHLLSVVNRVFHQKKMTKTGATDLLGDRALADLALNALREKNVLKIEGQKRGAKWVFTDEWVYYDHEVSGA